MQADLRLVRRTLTACALLVVCACSTSAEPAPTTQPTARSILPATSTPDGSPSPSAIPDDAGRGESQNAAAAADDDLAAAARPASPSAKPRPPSPTPTKKPEQPGISGQVLAGGKPVTDGRVTIEGNAYHHNTTTSSQGRFQSATPPGTYTVSVSSQSVSGCGTKTVTVKDNAVSHVTITCTG